MEQKLTNSAILVVMVTPPSIKSFDFFQPPAEGATTIHKNQWHFISTIQIYKQTTLWTPYPSGAISAQ
jgi:hypothetical protein